MRLRLLAIAALLAGSLCAADPELLSLVPPDAQLLGGWNVEQMMLSPLGQYIQSQAQQQATSEIEKMAEKTGFDVRRDLKEILIATTGLPKAAAPLFLARGNFNIPKIVEAATAEGQATDTYNGIQLVQLDKNNGVAFLDATLAIGGDAGAIRAAIDRRTAPAPINSSLAVAVNQASNGQDGWFISAVPPSQLGPGIPPNEPFAVLNKVVQVSGGVKLGANIVISLHAISQSAQDASAIAELVKSSLGMAKMAMGQEASAAAAIALLQSLQVSADGATTRVSLSISQPQIEELMRSKQGFAGFDGGHRPQTKQ